MRRPRRHGFAYVSGLSLVSVAACRGESDEARRADVGRVADAVRQLREAPNPAKGPLLKALESTACSADDARALKQACSDAYSLQARAMEGISAVRRATTRASPAEPLPSAAAALLSEVEANLQKAKTMEQSCADKEAELRRKYRL